MTARAPYAYNTDNEPWPEPSPEAAALLRWASAPAAPGQTPANPPLFSRELAQEALERCAFGGFADCALRLIPLAQPLPEICQALRWAVFNDKPEAVAALAGHFAQKPRERALCLAAELDRAECLALLIPSCDPAAGDSAALRRAASRGSLACLRLLLPLSDPSARGHEALFLSIQRRLPGICFELMAFHPPSPKAARALSEEASAHGLAPVAEALIALAERSDLDACCAPPAPSTRPARPSL